MVGAVDALAALDAAPPSERSADDSSPAPFLDGVERAMAVIGAPTVASITRDHVRHIPA